MFPYSFDQMVKTKVSKKKDRSTDSDSDEFSLSPEREVHRSTSTKKSMSKSNKRGRGTGNPPGQGRGNPPRQSCAQSSSSALGHPSSPIDEPDDDINLSYLVDSMASIRHPTRDHRKRGGSSIENLRYSEDPREEDRSFFGDARLWFPHQADWYESVIIVSTEMKWID